MKNAMKVVEFKKSNQEESKEKTAKVFNVGLCKGRHDIVTNDGEKVTDFIFENIEDPTDIESINKMAKEYLDKITVGQDPIDHKWIDGLLILKDAYIINLYVTGLTVVLVSFLNTASWYNVDITLYHFDIKTKSYYEQPVSIF